MRFKNYINRHNKKNRIYAEEELLSMTLNDLFDNEESILAQDLDIGIPTYDELKNSQNIRWYDPFVNSQGQQDGGFYGSILPNYPESISPHQKSVILEENPYRNKPISMNAMDDSGDELEGLDDYGEPETTEENPVVLDGGVSKTVIPQIEDLKDKIQTGIEEIKTKYETTKSKYEGLDWM